MNSLFDENEEKELIDEYPDIPYELALRVYTSRLIGKDSNLVLHGGGNTSVKLKVKNILGDDQDVLFIKGSGHDLETIGPEGFCGLDLNFLQRLKGLENIADEEMENQLLVHKIDAKSPDPSVETLLHAFLPHKYVDHTHADNILTLTNRKNGEDIIKKALGSKVGVLPYKMPGLPLAKVVARIYEQRPDLEAIVIINHGIFTFHNDAKKSYELMREYVNRAEQFINSNIDAGKKEDDGSVINENQVHKTAKVAQTIRGACAHNDKEGRLRRFYTHINNSPEIIKASFSKHAREICKSGVLTPDHVTRTKNTAVYIDHIPEDNKELQEIVKESVKAYIDSYDIYFDEQVSARGIEVEKLDPFPRVFLVAGIGLVTLGFSRKSARVAADIFEHNIFAKLKASAMGDYLPVSDSHVFDLEYWSLQQKKIQVDSVLPLQGQVALVTGAAGAIGFGIADRLIAAGAISVISDIDEPTLKKVHAILTQRYGQGCVESIAFDVTDFPSVEKAIEEVSVRVGGIDILVPNAGIAHVATIENLEPEKLNQAIAVNLIGTFNTIKASIPVFRRQGTGGNVVVISSKNVFDPGAAFGAYSASKAGAHQISRIAALELAEIEVRVNMINPDAVFGDKEVSSKLWDLIGPDRMKSRGLDPEGLKEYYRKRNLLKVSVSAEHVGNAVVFFASEQTPTTGATLPVDGGVPAASPR